MTFSRAILFLTLVCLALIPVAEAQTNPNLEIGFKPYGSYDGSDIDSVNLSSGDLTVHIPLFSYPQRGTLKSESVMALNTKIYKVFQNCNHLTGVCKDNWMLNTGTQYPYPPGISIRGTNLLGPYWTYNATYGYVYTTTTWDGAVHQMARNTATSTSYESTDNTGIWNDGTRVSPNNFGIVKQRNGDLAAQDTNGNYFSSTSDTIGRTSPSGTSTSDYTGCGGPVGQIISAGIGYFPAPNGTYTQVKVCNASISLKTNFHAQTWTCSA